MSSRSQKSKLAGLISSRVSAVVGVGTVVMWGLLVTVEVEATRVSYRLHSVKVHRGEDGMRVVVNRTLCESNAVCARLVPEVFVVDDDDRLQITQVELSEAQRERVEHAVRRCPKLALSIVED